MSGIAIRPATTADWPLIAGWLRQDEVQRWWGSLAAAEAEIRCAMATDMGLCSIVEAKGRPVGYVQALDAAPIAGVTEALTAGLFRIEAFIADPAHRGTGAGGEAMRLAAEEVFATTLALGAIAVVPLRFEGAVRACERAGFAWTRVVEDPLLGPCWLMTLERPVA